MIKYTLIITLIVTGSISGMSVNNLPNPDQNNSKGQFYQPGKTAKHTHPILWSATKTAGGTMGSFGGLVTWATYFYLLDNYHEKLFDRPLFKPAFTISARLKLLSTTIPFLAAGYIGGSAVAKSLWYPTCYGIDKVKQLNNPNNK